jgi:hypothetical protein
MNPPVLNDKPAVHDRDQREFTSLPEDAVGMLPH